jgi:hypothetical protein
MKKNIIVILSIIALLLCINACEREYRNKGRFEKNIPACIKQTIKEGWIVSAEEYCSTDGAKRIYRFMMGDVIFNDIVIKQSPEMMDDECNEFFVEFDEYPTLIPAELERGYSLPDGTIEFKEDIYHFKRIVFTKK